MLRPENDEPQDAFFSVPINDPGLEIQKPRRMQTILLAMQHNLCAIGMILTAVALFFVYERIFAYASFLSQSPFKDVPRTQHSKNRLPDVFPYDQVSILPPALAQARKAMQEFVDDDIKCAACPQVGINMRCIFWRDDRGTWSNPVVYQESGRIIGYERDLHTPENAPVLRQRKKYISLEHDDGEVAHLEDADAVCVQRAMEILDGVKIKI